MKARKAVITEADMVPTIQIESRKVTSATGAAAIAKEAITPKAGAVKRGRAEAAAIRAADLTAAGGLGAEDFPAEDIQAERAATGTMAALVSRTDGADRAAKTSAGIDRDTVQVIRRPNAIT
jgi:hypothetical protein